MLRFLNGWDQSDGKAIAPLLARPLKMASFEILY